jgi:hypothetical protein
VRVVGRKYADNGGVMRVYLVLMVIRFCVCVMGTGIYCLLAWVKRIETRKMRMARFQPDRVPDARDWEAVQQSSLTPSREDEEECIGVPNKPY